MKKNRLKKGFTIIELIVVIAILGILVLLAVPKFLGYTEKAKVTQIKNDIVAYEKAIDTKRIDDDKYIKDWEEIDVPTMESLKNFLFNKKGLINSSNEVTFSGEYYKIPKDNELVKTNLKGDFYLGQDGEVYYYDENLANKGDNETPTEKPENPTDEDLGYSEDDFTWIEDSDGYIGLNEEKGYFQYTGTGRSTVEIPHVIQGIPMTSYYSMFEEAPAEVTKVISTNKNVTNMSYMFYDSKATSLDLSELDTSNVTNMSWMFWFSQAKTLDLSKFNTSKVENMNGMFAHSEAPDLNLSNFNTSKVENMNGMFNRSQATSITFGPNFNTSNVTNMYAMFSYSQAESLDLSNFDTSNVTDMYAMFSYSQAKTLDLSSFDTSNVTEMPNISDMFEKSQATTGYARTQADANRFNASSNKPTALTFVVEKP